jgi:hypothetical protein
MPSPRADEDAVNPTTDRDHADVLAAALPMAALLDGVAAGVAVFEAAGVLRHVNRRGRQLLGLTRWSPGSPDGPTLVNRDRSPVDGEQQPWRVALRRDRSVEDVVYGVATGSGTRWLPIVARPMQVTFPRSPAEPVVVATVTWHGDGDASAPDADLAAPTAQRVLETIDDHLYTGEILPDGSYVELYCGPNDAALLGPPSTDGIDRQAAWEAAIHPDDRAGYRSRTTTAVSGCHAASSTDLSDTTVRRAGCSTGCIPGRPDRTAGDPSTAS